MTILIVAVAMMALLAMAALAIDIVTLYTTEGEAQRAADAAALAGAKVFVTSGFTSGQLGLPNSSAAQNLVCNGSNGFSDLQAQAVASHNMIAGTTPTTVTTSCNFSQPENPQITVTVQRTGLPTFFARIWGSQASSVTSKAKAEAYNPSGQAVPIQVGSVKPWLLPDCDPTHTTPLQNPNCAGGAVYYDATNYDGLFTGPPALGLQEITPGSHPVPISPFQYYAIDIPIIPSSASCPSPAADWGTCNLIDSGAPGYRETIACANPLQSCANPFQLSCLSCGQTVNVNPGSGSTLAPISREAALCLIHARNYGGNSGQDSFNVPPPGSSLPITIDGGSENPNTALQSATNISRSDSVVTVPLWDGHDPCPGGICSAVTIIGFMQLGIARVQGAGPGAPIDAYILNVSDCRSATGVVAVSGGGVSAIPVRLIQ